MKKVLIIEDETIISFGYRLQLERMGFEVIGVARSSDDAEAIMQEERPELIIMDIYLKGSKNGIELAKEIRITNDLPIIFLTASTRQDTMDAIREMNNCHYLAKPITSESLTEVLQRILRSDVHI